MDAASPSNAPVLVVGASPTGLTMALDLTQRGIKCRIIDRLPIPSDKSKALAMHARTLEMFDERGIVPNFLERGHKVHGTTISWISCRRWCRLSFPS